MSNELKEEIIIILNEARNKVNKSIMLFNKYDKDDVYLQAIKDLLNQELKELTEKKGNK